MSHKCFIDGSSAACFEHEGELWVKEYNDGKQKEGRTYRVNYCPQCGHMTNPMRVFIGELFNKPICEKKVFHVDQIKQDPYQRELPDYLRQYTFEVLQRLLKDLKNEKTVLNYDHTREWIGMLLSTLMEKIMCWSEWRILIPYLKFDPEWEVKIIPPFAGCLARFLIKKDEQTSISVYLDCYDTLGVMRQPYWEIYPYENDTYRVLLNDTDELIKRIREALEYKESC